MYFSAVMHHVAAHPEDPDAAAFADRARQWHDNYLVWGRSTLGFGYYLLQKN
ncbi:MAG: hypothetical protein ABI171_11575 [Collimonas sp.]|uniref:hypothetical protein n=1 Tax=Collimonas sp. TaxID=1963772 RepID=UPI0032643A8B